jgi:hypothetical protein
MGVLGSAFVYWVLPFLGIDTKGWFMPTPTSDIYLFFTWGGVESFFLISTFFVMIGYNAANLFRYGKKNPSVD